MRLTTRCRDVLRFVYAARWVSTGQLARRFFAGRTPDTARRWLRRAREAGLLRSFRPNRMSEAVFALGKKGGQTLEAMGIPGVTLERQVPRQLEHRLGINEIRVAAELVFDLTYFLAAWELPGAGWQEPVIPDAVFACCGRTYALEFDRGEESLKYFVRSKAEFYRRGLSGLPLAAVLIVADSDGRMRSLLAALGEASGPFVFSTLSLVRERGLAAAIFQRTSGGREERLF